MPQFLTEAELNVIKGLTHYLNENVRSGLELTVEAKLIDANGDHAGTITIHDGGEYGLVFP